MALNAIMKRDMKCYVVAAAAAMLPFLAGVGGGFLPEWDDGGFLLYNGHLSWSVRDLVWQFTHNLQRVYTPVATVSLTLDRTLLGMNPLLCRLHQLVLYGAAAAMLYGIFRALRVRRRIALALTLLWAWNPAKVETVCWISERKGVLSALFVFASMLLLLHGRRVAGSALLFLAVLSKPWTLPAPALMAIAVFCRRPHSWRGNLKTLIPPFCAWGAAAALTIGMTFRELSASSAFRPGAVFGNFLRYIAASLHPLNLNPVHPRFDWTAVWPEVAAGALLLILLAAAGLMLRVRGRTAAGFALSCVCLYLPVATGGGFTNADYADRYGFLLSSVFWLWAGVLLETYARRSGNGVLPRAVACVAAAALSLVSWTQIALYAPLFGDSAALFGAAASVANPNLKAVEGLGLVGLNRRNPVLLETAAAKMLMRRSDPAGRNTGLLFSGLAAGLRRDPAAARRVLVPLLEAGDPVPVYSGTVFLPAACATAVESLLRLRERERACGLLEIQLRRRWGDAAELHFASGLLGRLTGDDARAAREWRRALELRPDDGRIRYNLQVLGHQPGGVRR